jgi:hypothetical protein
MHALLPFSGVMVAILRSKSMSLHFSCAASPLLRVPGFPALMLFGLVSGYVLLSSFAFWVMVNFFVARHLAYFTGKSVFMAGHGRTGSAGFWGVEPPMLVNLSSRLLGDLENCGLFLLFWRFWFHVGLWLRLCSFKRRLILRGTLRRLEFQFIVMLPGRLWRQSLIGV